MIEESDARRLLGSWLFGSRRVDIAGGRSFYNTNRPSLSDDMRPEQPLSRAGDVAEMSDVETSNEQSRSPLSPRWETVPSEARGGVRWECLCGSRSMESPHPALQRALLPLGRRAVQAASASRWADCLRLVFAVFASSHSSFAKRTAQAHVPAPHGLVVSRSAGVCRRRRGAQCGAAMRRCRGRHRFCHGGDLSSRRAIS